MKDNSDTSSIDPHPTDDTKYNHISYQFNLAHEWLKSIKKCKCELDETSDDCRHIRKALDKLYGKQIDEMFNLTLREGIETYNKVFGFKVPYALHQAFND